MKLQHPLLRQVLIILLFALAACNSKYQQLFDEKTKDHVLNIQVNDNSKTVPRLSLYSASKIQLENIPLTECLASLMNKDIRFIEFEDDRSSDLMLNISFENFEKNATERKTKQIVLEKLKKAMNFTLQDYYPSNHFQIMKKDSVLLSKHLSVDKIDSNFVLQSKDRVEALNAAFPDIIKAFNGAYADKAYFVIDPNVKGRLSLKIVNIPFENLKDHLEKNIGLTFVHLSTVADAPKTSKVVFQK